MYDKQQPPSDPHQTTLRRTSCTRRPNNKILPARLATTLFRPTRRAPGSMLVLRVVCVYGSLLTQRRLLPRARYFLTIVECVSARPTVRLRRVYRDETFASVLPVGRLSKIESPRWSAKPQWPAARTCHLIRRPASLERASAVCIVLTAFAGDDCKCHWRRDHCTAGYRQHVMSCERDISDTMFSEQPLRWTGGKHGTTFSKMASAKFQNSLITPS